MIASSHNYQFIGRTGQFCPIKKEHGGGLLVRGENGKYASTAGALGYRWLESEVVRNEHREEDIDDSFYIHLVDDAIETISKFGDFEWFSS